MCPNDHSDSRKYCVITLILWWRASVLQLHCSSSFNLRVNSINFGPLCPAERSPSCPCWPRPRAATVRYSRDCVFIDWFAPWCYCVTVGGGQLGYPCLPGSSCADSNAVCVLGICLCHENFFEKNTRCCKFRVHSLAFSCYYVAPEHVRVLST